MLTCDFSTTNMSTRCTHWNLIPSKRWSEFYSCRRRIFMLLCKHQVWTISIVRQAAVSLLITLSYTKCCKCKIGIKAQVLGTVEILGHSPSKIPVKICVRPGQKTKPLKNNSDVHYIILNIKMMHIKKYLWTRGCNSYLPVLFGMNHIWLNSTQPILNKKILDPTQPMGQSNPWPCLELTSLL